MVCETYRAPQQTEEERRREMDEALRDLERKLQSGQVKLDIGPSGAIVFQRWGEERRHVSDACAFRTLTQRGSWELRRAVQRAEQQTGRKVNMAQVNSGVHSHDNGRTWHGGH